MLKVPANTYRCQISSRFAKRSAAKDPTRAQRTTFAVVRIQSGENRSLSTPPNGKRIAPGIEPTASTAPIPTPGPDTRKTSHASATKKAASASAEKAEPDHSHRKARTLRGFHNLIASTLPTTYHLLYDTVPSTVKPDPRLCRVRLHADVCIFFESTPQFCCINETHNGIVSSTHLSRGREAVTRHAHSA